MEIKAVKTYENGFMTQAFAFGGENIQIKMLEADGIEFVDETHVDVDRFLWHPGMDDE